MAFLAVGVFLGTKLTTVSSIKEPVKYSKFQEIIQLLDQEYVDSIKDKTLFEDAISDMLHKLDPHSNYIPAEDLKAVNEQIDGKFGGVGIRFAIYRDTLCVTNVVPFSPSYKAGVQAGDKIIAIEGKNVASVNLKNEEVLKSLKGDPATKVSVTLYRNKKKKNVTLIRDIIPISSIVSACMLNKSTGYIRLETFSMTSAEEFRYEAQKLRAQGMKNLIFDLRDNGGGVLSAAVHIADEFLPKGHKIVMVKGKKYKEVTYSSTAGGVLEKTKVVVLINENSASASEILAGAIQDNDRGFIVGRRSFGKGLVQQDFSLKDKSDLRLTVARYYTPSGRCIQKPFGESYEDYNHSYLKREKSGEFFKVDSSVFKNSKKFKTLKGRTVYDGGGIMPDYFIPLDTSNSTVYYVGLRFSGAFQQFAFNFVSDNRENWKNVYAFSEQFQVTDQMLRDLTTLAEKHLKVPLIQDEFNRSKGLIKRYLKAEIARQIFVENGYFYVLSTDDPEVQKALSLLK